MKRILFLALIVLFGLPGGLSAKQYGVITTPDITATTADINGGTVDAADVTVGAGKTLDVSAGTFTAADNQISGDKIDGGTISDFASTGIDDNSTETAFTITVDEQIIIGDTATRTIGGVDPSLQVTGTAGADTNFSLQRFSADTLEPQISLGKSRAATSGTYTIVQNNDLLMAITGATFAKEGRFPLPGYAGPD